MANKLGRFLVNTGRGVIIPIAGRKAPVRREKTQFFADASVTYNKTGPVTGSCVVRTASAARISGSIVPLSSSIDEDGNSPFMKYTTDEPTDFETGSLFDRYPTAFGSSVSEEESGGKIGYAIFSYIVIQLFPSDKLIRLFASILKYSPPVTS